MAVDIAILRELSSFGSFSDDQVGKVGNLCAERMISAGQTFFREGELGKTIFVVLQGEIQVRFTAGGGGLVSIEWIGAGGVLGIRAFFPPYRYLSTASSLTDGYLLAIDAVKLRMLVEQDSQLAILIHECLMEAMMNRVADLRSAS
jgi:CRP/FNR family transcriptional regulator, cyclic AMP receptor protein